MGDQSIIGSKVHGHMGVLGDGHDGRELDGQPCRLLEVGHGEDLEAAGGDQHLFKKTFVFFSFTRPKPAFGRQGLDWDRWARIQFSQVHFGAKLDSTALLWSRHSRGVQLTSFDPKDVTSPTGISN